MSLSEQVYKPPSPETGRSNTRGSEPSSRYRMNGMTSKFSSISKQSTTRLLSLSTYGFLDKRLRAG